MSRIKKSILVAGGVMAVGASSLIGAGAVSAQTSGSTSTTGPAALIQKIAQKFGLNEVDVKAVFDEDRAAHETEMRQNVEDRLTQAVAEGTITEDQKSQIQSKLNELDTLRDSLSDKTEDEKREAMRTKMDEIRTWAEDNDIPMDLLHLGGRHGGPRDGDMGEMTPPSDDSSTTE